MTLRRVGSKASVLLGLIMAASSPSLAANPIEGDPATSPVASSPIPALSTRSEPDATDALSVDPLELTQEMMDFVDERIPSRQSRRTRLHRLQSAIFDPDNGLGVTYGSESTYTAAGTFERRSGNCLSFTLLFAALARHLGLDTHFVEVDEVTGWSQRGKLGFSHWHMYAEVEIDASPVPVDFLPWTERRYRSSRRISEQRVRAHFHNNLGAGLVAAQDLDAALLHFQRALEFDPEFNPARINKAVAHRRSGEFRIAETLLLDVLRTESGNAVAAANLATLYLQQGRRAEAAKWTARRRAFLNRNPFHHFRLGLASYEVGNYIAARDHFKRAIRRQRDEALFFEHLAEARLRLGQTARARANLRKALRLTESPDRREAIEERLREQENRGSKVPETPGRSS